MTPLQLAPVVFDRGDLDDATLLHLYRSILLPRLIEERMLLLLRQGQLSKWFSGIGQEAISVGLGCALKPSDWIFPLHRNLGVFTTRGLPLSRVFAQVQGKPDGYTQARDRSFHFGVPEARVIGMISHLGAMLGVADGVALGSQLNGTQDLAVVFSGDGGTSEGDFHEAVNLAAVWDLPVIFLIENNGYGLSTPSRQQFRCEKFIDKAPGYGIDAIRVDGNNILDVYRAFVDLAEQLRESPRPVIFEAMTFRMRGHEEASGTDYVPDHLFEAWAKRDPVKCYETYLIEQGVLSASNRDAIHTDFKDEILQAWNAAQALPAIHPCVSDELGDVYAPSSTDAEPDISSTRTLRLVDAISEGLQQAMGHNPRIVIMGQDIAEYGGVFKITKGFVERFGEERVRNTPICESAVLGAGLGLSLTGHHAVIEMQFADFVSCGFNQIVNNLAKTHYRWGHPVHVTVRMPTGAGVGAGPFHSQSCEAWFAHVPGLKIVYPSTPADAKGLLIRSLEEPNPVLFFEHKQLYRSLEGPVPEAMYRTPLGVARVVTPGDRLTVVTYGAAVHWSLIAANEFEGIEIIDLRTLRPWDEETVFASVRKTNRCVVVHEATLFGGLGAEIAAHIGETCFEHLDAPVMRVGALETPVPFNRALEKQFLPTDRISAALQSTLAF